MLTYMDRTQLCCSYVQRREITEIEVHLPQEPGPQGSSEEGLVLHKKPAGWEV